jgi:hypothetical protein
MTEYCDAERMAGEVIDTSFKVLRRNSPAGKQENHWHLSQDSRCTAEIRIGHPKNAIQILL